jgi:hypothetical protein
MLLVIQRTSLGGLPCRLLPSSTGGRVELGGPTRGAIGLRTRLTCGCTQPRCLSTSAPHGVACRLLRICTAGRVVLDFGVPTC